MGDEVTINTREGTVTSASGQVVSRFKISPNTLPDEFRAGGRIPLIIGRSLTTRARGALGMGETDIFRKTENPNPKPGQGYTQAQ